MAVVQDPECFISVWGCGGGWDLSVVFLNTFLAFLLRNIRIRAVTCEKFAVLSRMLRKIFGQSLYAIRQVNISVHACTTVMLCCSSCVRVFRHGSELWTMSSGRPPVCLWMVPQYTVVFHSTTMCYRVMDQSYTALS